MTISLQQRLQRTLFRLALLSTAAVFIFLLLWLDRSARRPNVVDLIDSILDGAIQHRVKTTSHDLDHHALQRSLTCFTQGRWTTDTIHRQRKGLGVSYEFPSSCSSFVSGSTSAVAELCTTLALSQILLVGPETTFYLHSLWLDALRALSNGTLPCPGPHSCSFHHICRPPPAYPHEESRKRFPSREDLAKTNSSVLRYVFSTTLHTVDHPDDDAYTIPTVDPTTGVRVQNKFWMAYARAARLIIVNRGPLPAPASTYKRGDLQGNWSFANQLYLDDSTTYLNKNDKSLAIQIVNAALHATLTAFLPSTLRSLQVFGNHTRLRGKLLVWHGSWYLGQECSMGYQGSKLGSVLFVDDVFNSPRVIDPWSLYYNAQGNTTLGFSRCHLIHWARDSVYAEPPGTGTFTALWDHFSPSSTSQG